MRHRVAVVGNANLDVIIRVKKIPRDSSEAIEVDGLLMSPGRERAELRYYCVLTWL